MSLTKHFRKIYHWVSEPVRVRTKKSRPAFFRETTQTRLSHNTAGRNWPAGRLVPVAERPPAPPASTLYINCLCFPFLSVRQKERQGWVGHTVSLGRVTKPCGYEIRSDAVVSLGHFHIPIDLLTITSRRSENRSFSAN